MPSSVSAGESVAIVGAGLGGLTLAQSLSSHGIGYNVFERDPSLDAAGRRVRIHCRPSVVASLKECLPAWVFDAFLASQGSPDARHIYLDGQLQVLGVDERPDPEVALDTATTREVLALGIEDRLHMGREIVAVRASAQNRLTLTFSDGTGLDADVIVGADGAESMTRRYTPAPPALHDVQCWSVYGTVDLESNPELMIPTWLRDAFAIVFEGDLMVALGVYEPVGLARLLERAENALASVHLRRYLFWNVIARPETLRTIAAELARAPNRALESVVRLLGGISPWVSEAVRRSSATSIGHLKLQTSSRGRGEESDGALVLIGDAAHPMLPAALSASVAVDDARRLGLSLADAGLGRSLRERVARGKDQMLDAAFAKVREAELLAGPIFDLSGSGA